MFVVSNCLYIGTTNTLTMMATTSKNKEFPRKLTCVDFFFAVLPGDEKKKILTITFETSLLLGIKLLGYIGSIYTTKYNKVSFSFLFVFVS